MIGRSREFWEFALPLKELSLRRNSTIDVDTLAQLTNLEDLDLFATNVNDVSPLMCLTNLKRLNLAYSSVPDDAIEELRRALPNCRIVTSSDYPGASIGE